MYHYLDSAEKVARLDERLGRMNRDQYLVIYTVCIQTLNVDQNMDYVEHPTVTV